MKDMQPIFDSLVKHENILKKATADVTRIGGAGSGELQKLAGYKAGLESIVDGLQEELHAGGKLIADAIATRDAEIVKRDKRRVDNGY